MLPRCLAAARARRRRDRDRRHRLHRPHDRDRPSPSARRVIEREWTGSFSDARNVSFDAATGDWLMFLDADEVLVEEDVERLRALRGQTWREAFYLTEINYTGELGDGTAATHTALRVFRAAPEYRFSGRLHEQIAETLPLHLPERIEHDRHPRRALRLPRRRARREGEVAPQHRAAAQAARRGRRRRRFLHFNLGSEYGAVGDAQAALARVRARVGADRRATRAAARGASCRRSRAARARAAHLRPPRGLPSRAPTRGSRASRASPTSSSSRPGRARARATPTGRSRSTSAASRWATRRAATPRRSACGTFLPRIAIAEIHHARGATGEAVALLDAASPSTPASSASCCRSRRRCWPTASRPTRSWRASRRASPS